MKVFFRFYLPRRRQVQTSSLSFRHRKAMRSPQNATMDKTPQVLGNSSTTQNCAGCRLKSIWTLPVYHFSSAVQALPRPAKSVCVSSGSRQKLPCCRLGRLAPRLQLPGPHHRIGVGSKICLAVNADLQQHVSARPCPALRPVQSNLLAIIASPLTLLSAAAPLPLPVRGASIMCVPHAEL